METTNTNRSRIVGIRFTPGEYEKIEGLWKGTTCRKLSNYLRQVIFGKPVVTTYRNKSLDEFMAEAIRLRNELSAIGNNYNQAVKKLHLLNETGQFSHWFEAYETDRKRLVSMVETIKEHISKIGEQWLQ